MATYLSGISLDCNMYFAIVNSKYKVKSFSMKICKDTLRFHTAGEQILPLANNARSNPIANPAPSAYAPPPASWRCAPRAPHAASKPEPPK